MAAGTTDNRPKGKPPNLAFAVPGTPAKALLAEPAFDGSVDEIEPQFEVRFVLSNPQPEF
jgi:hypothetical protein